MRIVIDMLGAQVPSTCGRGIGRYIMSLVRALAKQIASAQEYELFLLINAQYTDACLEIKKQLADVLDESHFKTWYAHEAHGGINNPSSAIIHEGVCTALEPDVLLIPSLFDFPIPLELHKYKYIYTVVILYDIIPYIFKNQYLNTQERQKNYSELLYNFVSADGILAISEATRKDYLQFIENIPEKISTISSAVDADFSTCLSLFSETTMAETLQGYGIQKPYLLYTAGLDYRKNIDGLIKAYSLLPNTVRQTIHLVIVCSISNSERKKLLERVQRFGLDKEDVIFTGFVPDDALKILYHKCKLFVFPSLYEGFGLPILEAMACGAPVIASNTSSIPEALGKEDALFDPNRPQDIAQKITKALTNSNYLQELQQHSKKQVSKFSWERVAHRALNVLKHSTRKKKSSDSSLTPTHPNLAYVSPLPPDHTGIADYSVELLPHLKAYYSITCIVPNPKEIQAQNPELVVQSIDWFENNYQAFDRVVYQFGNSSFHTHMVSLLEKIPGITVLHDFFLNGPFLDSSQHFREELYRSHGYAALKYLAEHDITESCRKYPTNRSIIEASLGIISHSHYAQQLAATMYGESHTKNWSIVPQIITPYSLKQKENLREKLGLKKEDCLVCTVGHIGHTKCCKELFQAWQKTKVHKEKKTKLIFLGQLEKSTYCNELISLVQYAENADDVIFTGYISYEELQEYLDTADIVVQLRTFSRGETSRAVLSAMAQGKATLINANGAFAEFPQTTVKMIPDNFSIQELTATLDLLWEDPALRRKLGENARSYIQKNHTPEYCAQLYYKAIESMWATRSKVYTILPALAMEWKKMPEEEQKKLVHELAKTFPPRLRMQKLFIDISELCQRDVKSGIQRVTRSILDFILHNPPQGYEVHPVYASADDDFGYRYAHKYMSKTFGYMKQEQDSFIDFLSGDIFLGLDLQPDIVFQKKTVLQKMHGEGVAIFFVVYDILPVQLPDYFGGNNTSFINWLNTIGEFDGLISISQAVSTQVQEWMKVNGPKRAHPLQYSWFHLGSDIKNSLPTIGLPEDATSLLANIKRHQSILMVSTVEPRKGYRQTLKAFELLWEKHTDINLVIIGKQGWNMDDFARIVKNHPESGKHLFWLQGISDEYLEKIYDAASGVLMASEGEGFGLAIVEGARHGKPLILRDLPVFREIAGENAFYFSGLEAEDLAQALEIWIDLYKKKQSPPSKGIKLLTWEESAKLLLNKLPLASNTASSQKN